MTLFYFQLLWVIYKKMLDSRIDKGFDIDIIFNAIKSSLFTVGKLYDGLFSAADVVTWNENLKYFGLSFKYGKTLHVDIEVTLCKFYVAANSIYSNPKYASEILKLLLMESYCLPLISYGYESLNRKFALACWLFKTSATS